MMHVYDNNLWLKVCVFFTTIAILETLALFGWMPI